MSKTAMNLIKAFENCSLVPYKDSAGLYTIGWGHLIQKGEQYLLSKRGITQEQADNLFEDDFNIVYNKITFLSSMKTYQSDAIISLVFNIGLGAFRSSTLSKTLLEEDIDLAGLEILKWCHVGGAVSQGLLKRRSVEHAIYYKDTEISDLGLVKSTKEDAQRILTQYWEAYNG